MRTMLKLITTLTAFFGVLCECRAEEPDAGQPYIRLARLALNPFVSREIGLSAEKASKLKSHLRHANGKSEAASRLLDHNHGTSTARELEN